jgi:pectinesterase
MHHHYRGHWPRRTAWCVALLSALLGLACGQDWLPSVGDPGTDAGGAADPDVVGRMGVDADAATRDASIGTYDAGLPDEGGAGRDAGIAAPDAGAGGLEVLCPGATRVVTVSPDGAADFKTIQAAVRTVSANNPTPVEIHLRPGTYAEHVDITQPRVCLTGESAETTTITATAGTNIVSGGTVIITGADFSAANITFENSAPKGSGQAVALMANGGRQQFIGCRFLSFQDTLFVAGGTQYFRRCHIQGSTDFIFGEATAVFEECAIHSAAEGTAIVAPRTPQDSPYGFVFLGGSLTANLTGSAVRDHVVHLGRPWGPYAAAAFIGVSMGAHIAAEGWTTMGTNDLTNTRFSEYASTGSGAAPENPTRAPRQLTATQAASYTVSTILEPWDPGYRR